MAAASIGAISDPILLSLPSLRRIHVSDFETHGGGGDDEVASGFGGGHFGLAVKSALPSAPPPSLPPSFLPLSPILVWKHDEPHFHVEPTGERTNGRSAAQFGSEIGSSPFCIAVAVAAVRSNFSLRPFSLDDEDDVK